MNESFELKYKITDADVKAVNNSLLWTYFIPYLISSLLGLAVGISATILKPRTEIFVLGIALIVLGAILLVCTVLLVVAPNNFVASALITSDETERTVRFDDSGITIVTDGQSDISIRYTELTKIKNKTTHLVAFIGKKQVLIIKDAITSGQSLAELFGYIQRKLGKVGASSAIINETPSGSIEDGNPAEERENTEEETGESK